MIITFGFKCFGIPITYAGSPQILSQTVHCISHFAQRKEQGGFSDGRVFKNQWILLTKVRWISSFWKDFSSFFSLAGVVSDCKAAVSAPTMSAFFDDLLLSSNLKTPLQRLLVTRYTSTTKAKPKRKTRLKGLENEPQTAASASL